MAVTLSKVALDHAKMLIARGNFIFDGRDAWSEHRPTAQQENEFIWLHGFQQYAKWYLGINDEKPENTKARYEFPFGDFVNVHRCGLLSAESRAGQYKHRDIENAAHKLHQMMGPRRGISRPGRSSAGAGGKAGR
jgi:hypothetical protein